PAPRRLGDGRATLARLLVERRGTSECRSPSRACRPRPPRLHRIHSGIAMKKVTYIDEYGERWAMARADRRLGLAHPDPTPPAGMDEARLLFIRKFVAHCEGGPHPDDPAATGDLADVPMPARRW